MTAIFILKRYFKNFKFPKVQLVKILTDIFYYSIPSFEFFQLRFLQNLDKDPLPPPEDYNPAVTVLQKLTLQSER